MATPTLDAYRAANPSDTRPDNVVIPSLVNQLQAEGSLSQFPDLIAAHAQIAQMDDRPGAAGEFMRGAVSGGHSAIAKIASTAAQIGGIVGNEGLKRWGMDKYNEQMQAAAAFAPTIGSMSQVHSPEDAARYGLGFAGAFVPQAAGIMGAGATGTLVGGPAGGLAATGAAMYSQSQNYGELVNQGAQNPEAISAGVGAIGAVLQAYVPHQVFSKLFGSVTGGEASTALNDVMSRAETALPGLGSYLAKDMAKQGGTLAVANAATEIATMAGEQYANRNNPNYQPLTPTEIKQRIIESASSGALLGGAFGAVEGMSDRSSAAKQAAIDKVKLPELLAARDAKDVNAAQVTAARMDAAAVAPVAQTPPETSPVTEPIGTPSSDAFTAPGKTEPEMVAPAPAPAEEPHPLADVIPQQVEQSPEQIVEKMKQTDPDLARRAALGQATPEEIMSVVNPPAAPDQHVLPPEPAGQPIAAEPPPAPEPPPQAPVAPAEWVHQQEDADGNLHDMYNLNKEIRDPNGKVIHSIGSTVSADTLQRHGFQLPEKPELPPAAPVSMDATPGNAATPLPAAAAPLEPEPTTPKKSEPPAEPLPIFSTKPIPDTFPELRLPPTYIKSDASAADIDEVAKSGLRASESSVNTSKKLLVVHDRDSNTVRLLPLFRSTGNEWRVAMGQENPTDVLKKVSDYTGKKVSYIKEALTADTKDGELFRALYGDASQRVSRDPFIKELLDMTGQDGQRRYNPVSMLDTMEAINRRVFEFKDYDKFKQRMEEVQAKLIPETAGGQALPDATFEKLKQLDPDHARLVSMLASVVESEREHIPSLRKAGEADAMRKLLKVPDPRTASEKLGAATKVTDLISRFGPNDNEKSFKWLGLFENKEDMAALASVIKNPKELSIIPGDTPQEKVANVFKAFAKQAGYTDWKDYLVKASSLLGEKQRGEELNENAEAGVAGPGKKVIMSDKTKEVELPVSEVKLFKKEHGDSQLGGMSKDELAQLQGHLANGVMDGTGEDEEPGLDHNTGADILAAREDSEMEGPEQDDEFNDVKGELRDFIDHVFEQTRGKDSSMMTDEQLYKVWSVLDRAARNTMPAKDDYRETNTEISNRYRATVSSLMGMGVDVNLIETSLDAQADILTKEMEQVQFGDGRRILIQTMSDVQKPSMENLRTTLHGAAHILFHNESASVRGLLLDAVDRMTNLKLDVFSKTRDARISENSTLSGSLLAEEVLAEHMSYFGLKQKVARDLAGKFIGAIKQIYLRGAILWAQVRGYALDPKIAQAYMENRMTEFVDKTLTSAKDLDVMTGNVQERASHVAQMFTPIGSEWHRSEYDPLTQNTIIKDVVPMGRMETLFNLDNRLQFHDYVIRNTKTDKPTVDYFSEHYGVSDKPSAVSDMLDKIRDIHEGSPLKSGGEVKYIIDGIKQNMPNFLKDATVRMASTDEDFQKLSILDAGKEYRDRAQKDGLSGESPAMFLSKDNEILINPRQTGRYDMLGAAYTLLHETLHVGMTNVVDLHRQFKLMGRDAEATLSIHGNEGLDRPSFDVMMRTMDRLDGIFSRLKDNEFYPNSYGMLNLDEFASEVMTNRIFQNKLAKEILPDKLTFSGRLKSAWDNVVHIITSLVSGGTERGNAYTESVRAIESVLRVADGHMFAPSENTVDPRAPMTQADSDELVKKDYEYQYAAHNSWIDMVNDQIVPLAKKAGIGVGDYLQRIFGISHPHDAREALDESLAKRTNPLPVNKDLRLADTKGRQNQLQPGSVKDNVIHSVLQRGMGALTKLDEIHDDMTRRLPGFEEALKEKQDRFVKWDTKLNDMTQIRDQLTRALRKQMGSLMRNMKDATYWSTEHHGLAGVLADLFGIKEGGYGVPDDIIAQVRASAEMAGSTDEIPNLLAAFEQYNMNVAGKLPSEIEAMLQENFKNTQDERLAPFIDGSPKAKADLAIAVYSAKTDPESSMLLGIRSEKDMELKQMLVNELKESVRKAAGSAATIPQLMKLSDTQRQRVMGVRRVAARYKAALQGAKDDLDNAKLVTAEAGTARKAMQDGIADMQADHNIQVGAFYPSHGASIILTPDPKGETKMGTLSLLKKDTNKMMQHVMDNQMWLKQNEGMGGPKYSAIKSQFEALKSVAGGYFQSDVQKSFYAKIFESIGTRLRYTGNATAKMAADMVDRYVNADRAAEKLTFIGRDVTEAQGKAMKAFGFEKNYDGFIRTMFNPMCHFLEHYDTRDSDEGRESARQAMLRYFMGKPETADWIRRDPTSFDKLWDFYNVNLKANHGIRDFAASDKGKAPVLVKDPTLPIKDPFTGRVGPSYRGALDTGYGTTQRDTTPLFELKRTLDSVKTQDNRSAWTIIPKASEGPITPDMEKSLFTPEVIDKFVRPYMDDVSSLHFPSPRGEDGESYKRADPVNVQSAWAAAHADIRKFSDELYGREVGSQPSVGGKDEFHQDVLRFFAGQYKKIANLTEGQEEFQKRGFGPNFISSNMMDTRKAEDFPPEFTKYRIYDHISLQQMVNNVAAHGTLGRDLGLFDGANDRNHGIVWMLHAARQELEADHNNLLAARSTVLRSDPRLAATDVEARLKKQFGDKEYNRLSNLPYAMREVDAAEKNLYGVLTAPNGSTREFSAGAATLQTMVEFMLNNFRSVLNSSNRLIAPYQVYGAGKVGHTQVLRSIAGSARATMGSFAQAMLGDARMANDYDRLVHNSSVGLDRANFMTPATIIADTGKNNAYETQKYLGTVRKLRDVVFNTGFKPQDEEERIAPALRPQAPYAMLSEAMDMGVMSSEAQIYNDLFKAALAHYELNPQDANNPAFRFSKETLNPNMPMPLSDDNVTRFHQQMQTMGSNLELEVRNLADLKSKGVDIGGDVIVPKHLMPLIVSQGLSDIALSSDVNKGPAWMYSSKFGRFGMFLMKWATLQMNQVVGMAKTRDGELNWRNGKGMAITMAAGIIPASVAISMLLDEYDENVLGKKSNAIGFNWDSPQQTAAALMERTSRIGTFGLMGDVANGLRVYGSDGDTRGLSFDQRVVFMNTLMSTLSLVNTAVHQDGHLTYDTFYRPLLNTLGGNSILQYGQITNKIAVEMGGQPIFQSEYEQTTRINALNYLRGAGRIAGVPIKEGGGEAYTPTPMHPYMSAMVLSAYANDMGGFQDAYRGAIEEARKEGEDDPEGAVKRSFAAYHPLKYVYQAEPTTTQLSRIMMSLSDKGREDVASVIGAYDRYASLLGIKSKAGAPSVASRSKTKSSPSAF